MQLFYKKALLFGLLWTILAYTTFLFDLSGSILGWILHGIEYEKNEFFLHSLQTDTFLYPVLPILLIAKVLFAIIIGTGIFSLIIFVKINRKIRYLYLMHYALVFQIFGLTLLGHTANGFAWYVFSLFFIDVNGSVIIYIMMYVISGLLLFWIGFYIFPAIVTVYFWNEMNFDRNDYSNDKGDSPINKSDSLSL